METEEDMATNTLDGLRVAILVTDGFEQVEMTEPRKALDAAGARTRMVSPKESQVKAWNFTEWGDTFPVDMSLDQARPEDFDSLLLPGGVINPDTLRTLPAAVAFVKGFFDAEKPVASICHGPWTVIEAGGARGRRLTSWPSLRTDLQNAGAQWVDEAVVVDRGLVTSRNPDDIPAFNKAVITLFDSARAQARPAAAQ
jgi:protease I